MVRFTNGSDGRGYTAYFHGATAAIDDRPQGGQFTILVPTSALDALYAEARQIAVRTYRQNRYIPDTNRVVAIIDAGGRHAYVETGLSGNADTSHAWALHEIAHKLIETTVARPDPGFPTARPEDFLLSLADGPHAPRIYIAHGVARVLTRSDSLPDQVTLGAPQLDRLYAAARVVATTTPPGTVTNQTITVTIGGGGHRRTFYTTADAPHIAALLAAADELPSR